MVLTVLVAILHLTNIVFNQDENNNTVYIEDESPPHLGMITIYLEG